MNWYDYLLLYLSSESTLIFLNINYGKINNNEIKLRSVRSVFIIIIFSLLITINTNLNNSYSRAFISYVFIMINYYLIYNENFNVVFIKGTICYFLTLLFEILFSIALVPTGIISLESFDKNIILKICFSFLTVLLPFILLSIKKLKIFLNKLIKALDRPIITTIVMTSSLIFASTLAYKFVAEFSSKVYIDNIILIIFFISLLALIIHNRFVINNEVRKTEELLELITKYEKKNDEYRAYKHELLNNLLALKSIKNKNTKEFDSSLDELISLYNTKSSGIKNIYKLPSGLKCIVYYKLNDIDEDKYNVNVNISKQVSINLEKVDHKEYMSLCKIMGIVLDNAIEAMKNSEGKTLNIDVYKEKDNVIIEVDNTFDKSTTDITKIYNKNYSTKGKNRGLGLYLANLLLKNSKYLHMEQRIINEYFNTKIYVK